MNGVKNHPVHITEDKLFSSFIPFCSFGGDMKTMGTKLEQFDEPVCNSFGKKMHHDQICYEVDLDKYKDKSKIKNQLKYGLVLILDYNEDRQMYYTNNNVEEDEDIFAPKQENTVNIHLNTIGNRNNIRQGEAQEFEFGLMRNIPLLHHYHF